MAGHSMPDQIRLCLDELSILGIPCGLESNIGESGVFTDPGVSAWKVRAFNRSGFSQMWSCLQSGDRVVIVSLDRMFRSVIDFARMAEEFQQRGIVLISIRENMSMATASGRFLCHIAAAFAELKSSLISERVKEAFALKKQREVNREPKPAVVPIVPLSQHFKPRRGMQLKVDSLTQELVKYRWGKSVDEVLRMESLRDAVKSVVPEFRPGAKVYSYLRVSTEEQSVDSQRIPVNRVIDRLKTQGTIQDGGEIVDHGVSAFRVSFPKRPGGLSLMKKLRPGDHIVIARVDRMFRSIRDMIHVMDEFRARQITVHAADAGWRSDTEEGRRFLDMMGMMAEWESREMGWRKTLSNISKMKRTGDPMYASASMNSKVIRVVPVSDGQYGRTMIKSYCRNLMTLYYLSKYITKRAAVYVFEVYQAKKHGRMPIVPLRFINVDMQTHRGRLKRLIISARKRNYSKKAILKMVQSTRISMTKKILDARVGQQLTKIIENQDPALCEEARIEAKLICDLYGDPTITKMYQAKAARMFFAEAMTKNFEKGDSMPSIRELTGHLPFRGERGARWKKWDAGRRAARAAAAQSR